MDFSEQAVLDEMSDEIGGYNVYNIYDQCKLANDNVKLHTFREWEDLLGGNQIYILYIYIYSLIEFIYIH